MWSICKIKEDNIDKSMFNNSMHAYFDSPETIRNKVKEFKTATFNGLNKQDVTNYLSTLAEQQGIMIKLMRENNLPLFVDDGYNKEEQFEKPAISGQDYLSQYFTGSNSNEVAELQAEIQALKAEIEQYKSNVSQDDNNLTDFDIQLDASSNEELELLKLDIEEKDKYIKELESALQNSSNAMSPIDTIDNSQPLSDVERQAYEEEILNLRAQLTEATSTSNNTSDLFETEIVSIDEDVKDAYEREIDSLRSEIEELKASTTTTLDSNELVAESEEVSNLKETIFMLEATVASLQSDLQVCHELLEEAGNSTPTSNESSINDNNVLNTSNSTESNLSTEDIDSLKATIEVLELEVSKKDREKASVEFKLEELSEELSKYKAYKDEDGNCITLDFNTLIEKHNEVLAAEKAMLAEKESINNQLELLREKESLIENNKHLVSEDFVNNLTLKEQEIDRLRKQMDKMLLVAQATADETEKEATAKATEILDEAKSKYDSIIAEAETLKATMQAEAEEVLNSAKEFKTVTEEELNTFREETRKNAEDIILDAQNKASAVLEEAQVEAERAQANAIEEVERIMAEAESRVVEIDAEIQSKQKEIDNIQKYYLKVRNEGIVGIKKLYNQLENIIYNDEQLS